VRRADAPARKGCRSCLLLIGFTTPNIYENMAIRGRRAVCGSVSLREVMQMRVSSVEKRVREAGLRPTRQRVALAELLFAKGDRHLSAEELHEEAMGAGVA